MRVLDLCCGAGGASAGYARAGFDVVGVDALTQRHYPFEFHQADALTFPLHGFDLVHVSPPCQAYSRLAAMHPGRRHEYPRLIEPLRDRLRAAGVPYVIENVEGAPLVDPVVLCGSMFGLCVDRGWLRRHRLFECSFPVSQPACAHPFGVYAVGVYGGGGHVGRHRMLNRADKAAILEIDWMTRDELNQAIPPAYTEYIAHEYLRNHRGGVYGDAYINHMRRMAERMDDMADKAKEGATATTTRNRQVISLPADLAARVNAKGREMSEAVKAITRVDPNLSLTDVAQSLLTQALDDADAAARAAAESNGDAGK